MLTYQQVMDELEAQGTEQNRKIYRRHGAASEQIFGVSYGNLDKLKKKIKVDHELARQLWDSGNHDARALAMKIADPQQADPAVLAQWASDLGDYILTDSLSGYIGQTALARATMERWTQSDDEWIGAAGWNLLGELALKDDTLPDSFFEPYLAIIESDIHQRKNRVRYAMNNVLIAIGARNDALEAQAMAVAARIGKVEVDHGQTGCKTPDAASYIQKTRAHRNRVRDKA